MLTAVLVESRRASWSVRVMPTRAESLPCWDVPFVMTPIFRAEGDRYLEKVWRLRGETVVSAGFGGR
jgi:hypothetical protein